MSSNERGTSLVEVLVSVMFLGLFAAEIHQFSRMMLRGVRVLETASEAQEAARIGVALIVHDLRSAGYDGDGSLGNGLRVADAEAVEIATDLNADGDTDDSQELVGYRFDRDRQTLERVMAGVSQPMLEDVAPNGFSVSYFSSDGSALATSGGPLDDAARKRVRRIDIAFAIAIAHPDSAYTTAIRAAQTASICLRNE